MSRVEGEKKSNNGGCSIIRGDEELGENNKLCLPLITKLIETLVQEGEVKVRDEFDGEENNTNDSAVRGEVRREGANKGR